MGGQVQPAVDESIRVLVSVPITRIGVGVFSFDPVEQLLGAPLADLLEPLRVGPVERRPSSSGTAGTGTIHAKSSGAPWYMIST